MQALHISNKTKDDAQLKSKHSPITGKCLCLGESIDDI